MLRGQSLLTAAYQVMTMWEWINECVDQMEAGMEVNLHAIVSLTMMSLKVLAIPRKVATC